MLCSDAKVAHRSQNNRENRRWVTVVFLTLFKAVFYENGNNYKTRNFGEKMISSSSFTSSGQYQIHERNEGHSYI